MSTGDLLFRLIPPLTDNDDLINRGKMKLHRRECTTEAVWMTSDLRGDQTQDRCSNPLVFFFAVKFSEPEQNVPGHGISRGCRIIVEILVPHDKLLVV